MSTDKFRFAHAGRADRILSGAAEIIARDSKGFRWPVPIAGTRLATYDGDLIAPIGGYGFASISDLIYEATVNGKRQEFWINKFGTANVAAYVSYWNASGYPQAGGAPTAIPGGAVPTNTQIAGFGQTDPATGETLHVTACGLASIAGAYLFYDRLWHGASVSHTTVSDQAVTGVPTRYTGTSAGGNFMFLEVTTALGATSQAVTFTYVDEQGNSAETAAPVDIITSAAATRIPYDFTAGASGPYFVPLNEGDYGVRNITNVKFNIANSAGVSNAVIGHPLFWVPSTNTNRLYLLDLVNNPFGPPEVKTGACIALLGRRQTSSPEYVFANVIMVSG